MTLTTFVVTDVGIRETSIVTWSDDISVMS